MNNTTASLTIIAAAMVAAWAIIRRDNAAITVTDTGPDGAYLPASGDTMPDQTPGLLESAMVQASTAAQSLSDSVGLTAAPDRSTAERNENAFLDMIAYSEGTGGPNGYRTLFGGGLFTNMSDHPRQFFTFTDKVGRVNKTSAAGRYQFLARTWDDLANRLGLIDFGPASQDAAALELIRQRGALQDVQAGRIAAAIAKCAPIWASLPGANYNQPERKLSSLLASYSQAGGNLKA